MELGKTVQPQIKGGGELTITANVILDERFRASLLLRRVEELEKKLNVLQELKGLNT